MSKSGRQLSSASSRIGFLWQSYAPQYWYWEIVDTTRRLMLTAVNSVCFPGTAKQSILAIFLTTLYFGLYNYCKPYANPTSNTLAELGLAQIHYTFFGMMIFQNDLLTDDDQTKLGGVLIVINMTLVIMIMWHLWEDYQNLMKKKKKNEKNTLWKMCMMLLWPARATQPTTQATTQPVNTVHISPIHDVPHGSTIEEAVNVMHSSSSLSPVNNNNNSLVTSMKRVHHDKNDEHV